LLCFPHTPASVGLISSEFSNNILSLRAVHWDNNIADWEANSQRYRIRNESEFLTFPWLLCGSWALTENESILYF
jgi:hypothetical protein